MIELRDQAYHVTGLPKNLHIIFPQVVHKSEVYKVTFVANCHNEHDSYAELNLKEDKPGWQKDKLVERIYIL